MEERRNNHFDGHIQWCPECKVPVIAYPHRHKTDVIHCPLCHAQTSYLSKDIRPVFPEEKLLLELLLDKKIGEFKESSVWCENNRYFIDGKSFTISTQLFDTVDTNNIKQKLEQNKQTIAYTEFNSFIEKFCEVNKARLKELIDESQDFIKQEASKFPEENIVISFSGGKDSSVVTDIVTKALSNPSLVHIYGDTTLEFPQTLLYVERFKKNHPYAIFQIAKNDEQDFMNVCDDIGPPARMMRWCCTMFKTGPISRVLNGLYRNQQVLTFYGIRSAESVARSKYNRIENNKESIKILQQTVAAPILHWKDIDVWLYLFSENVDFNDAYRLGYDRVGCWCCPNNNQRAQFLSRIYMTEKSSQWRTFLINFAKKIGKPDPEIYVDTGAWKARQGGNGLTSSEDIKIRFTNCTAEENAKNYSLNKPFDEELIGLFTPFGAISKDLGKKILSEILILDKKTNVPIISLQPFTVDNFKYAVKIKTMNVENHQDLHRKIAYQIRKFNACRQCLKCESICKAGAITISSAGYFINPQKCVHCKMCVNQKVLENGCLMGKFLRTKETKNTDFE